MILDYGKKRVLALGVARVATVASLLCDQIRKFRGREFFGFITTENSFGSGRGTRGNRGIFVV
jgi:hypothetical protein